MPVFRQGKLFLDDDVDHFEVMIIIPIPIGGK